MTSIDGSTWGILKTTDLDNVAHHVIPHVEFRKKPLLNLVSNSLPKLFATGIGLVIGVVPFPGKDAEF